MALGNQPGVRDDINHELMRVERGRHRRRSVEVNFNLSRPGSADAGAHDPAGRSERADRRGSEHTSSADDECALGA